MSPKSADKAVTIIEHPDKKYGKLLDAAGDVIFQLDLEGRYLFINETGAQELGLSQDALVGRRLGDFFPEAESMMAPVREVARTGKSLSVSGTAPASGKWAEYFTTLIPVRSLDGTISSVLGVARDITRRKRVARAVERSHQLLRNLVSNMGEGVGIVDAEERFQYANPTAHTVFGVPRGQLKRRSLREFVTDPSWERIMEQTNVRKQGEKSTYDVEIIRPDGQSRIISVTATPKYSPAGVYRGAFGVFADITEERAIATRLQKTSEELEIRVRERTRQLDRLVEELQGEIEERQRTELARLRTEEELLQSRERLRQLATSVESNREEETKRIAREIHDELGQNLTAVKFGLNSLKKMLPSDQPEMQARLSELLVLLDSTCDSVRRIAQNLRPPMLDHFGLTSAVECLGRDFEVRTGVETTVQLPAEPVSMNDGTATAIFRICQEALTNVARHADAQSVRLALQVSAGVLLLEITDDGKGIGVGTQASTGLGLLGMEERALRLGGRLIVGSGEDRRGTRIAVTIPLARPEENS